MILSEPDNVVPKRGNRFTKFLGQWLLSLFGWRIEANIPNEPKMVLVGAPHTSNVDFLLTMATMYALGVKISWMAKSDLFRWPVAGLLRWLGGVPVVRGESREGLVEQTVAAFTARDQFMIAIMPEGTRSKVGEWKTGFYRIAQGAGVPILLVKFDYGRKIMGIGPTFIPTDDLAGGMSEIKACYEGITGRHPVRM